MRALVIFLLALTAGSAHAQFSPPPGGGSVAAITSGTIDGAAIGGTTPATGVFTSLSATAAIASAGVLHGVYTWSHFANIIGAGTTLATATTTAVGTVKITSCPSGAGIRLPLAPSSALGFTVTILNRSGTTCLLYPNGTTTTIEGGTGGAPVTLASGGNYELIGDSMTDWLQVSQ